MEEKIRRSLKEPVQAFPRYLAEKAGTRTKNRNEAERGGGGGEGEGSIKEIKSHVDGKRTASDSSWEFLRIENKHMKTVQNNSNG